MAKEKSSSARRGSTYVRSWADNYLKRVIFVAKRREVVYIIIKELLCYE